MKVRVKKDHCDRCIWLIEQRVCPFKACVRRFGFGGGKRE